MSLNLKRFAALVVKSKVSLLVLALCLLPGRAHAVTVSFSFNTVALGFDSIVGNVAINTGGVVDADMPGLVTSPTTGEGSILSLQLSGVAGVGTQADPLAVLVTANTHLDTTVGVPNYPNSDYHAGIIAITAANAKGAKKEGLGVRAFTIDGPTANRLFDGGTGLALLEGSKDISGGTDSVYHNGGPPHVDEAVSLAFTPSLYAQAQTVQVLLSRFKGGGDGEDGGGDPELFDLHIERLGGADIDLYSLTYLDLEMAGAREKDQLWKLNFAGIPGLAVDDLIVSFSIRANASNGQGTSTHFLITGMDAEVVPEPATICLLGLGTLVLLKRRRP